MSAPWLFRTTMIVTGGPELPEIVTVAVRGPSLTNCLPVGVTVTFTVTHCGEAVVHDPGSLPPVTLVMPPVLTETQLADGGLMVKSMSFVPVAVSNAVSVLGDVLPAFAEKNSVVEHPPSIRNFPELPVAATVKVTGPLRVLLPFAGLIWIAPL